MCINLAPRCRWRIVPESVLAADALIQLVVIFLQLLLHSYDYENYRHVLNCMYTYARIKKL